MLIKHIKQSKNAAYESPIKNAEYTIQTKYIAFVSNSRHANQRDTHSINSFDGVAALRVMKKHKHKETT